MKFNIGFWLCFALLQYGVLTQESTEIDSGEVECNGICQVRDPEVEDENQEQCPKNKTTQSFLQFTKQLLTDEILPELVTSNLNVSNSLFYNMRNFHIFGSLRSLSFPRLRSKMTRLPVYKADLKT